MQLGYDKIAIFDKTRKWYKIGHSYYGTLIGFHNDLSNGAISNKLEWPLTQISRSRHYVTPNISETVRYSDIVTVEYYRDFHMPFSRVSFRISNGLEWVSEIFNDMKHRAVSLRQLSFLLLKHDYATGHVGLWVVGHSEWPSALPWLVNYSHQNDASTKKLSAISIHEIGVCTEQTDRHADR